MSDKYLLREGWASSLETNNARDTDDVENRASEGSPEESREREHSLRDAPSASIGDTLPSPDPVSDAIEGFFNADIFASSEPPRNGSKAIVKDRPGGGPPKLDRIRLSEEANDNKALYSLGDDHLPASGEYDHLRLDTIPPPSLMPKALPSFAAAPATTSDSSQAATLILNFLSFAIMIGLVGWSIIQYRDRQQERELQAQISERLLTQTQLHAEIIRQLQSGKWQSNTDVSEIANQQTVEKSSRLPEARPTTTRSDVSETTNRQTAEEPSQLAKMRPTATHSVEAAPEQPLKLEVANETMSDAQKSPESPVLQPEQSIRHPNATLPENSHSRTKASFPSISIAANKTPTDSHTPAISEATSKSPTSPEAHTQAQKNHPAELSVEDLLQEKLSQRKRAQNDSESEKTVPTKNQVTDAMTAIAPQVKKCGQGQERRIRMKLAVSGATGRVVNAQVMDTELVGTPTAICATGAARLAKFPKFSQQLLVIKYPFDI